MSSLENRIPSGDQPHEDINSGIIPANGNEDKPPNNEAGSANKNEVQTKYENPEAALLNSKKADLAKDLYEQVIIRNGYEPVDHALYVDDNGNEVDPCVYTDASLVLNFTIMGETEMTLIIDNKPSDIENGNLWVTNETTQKEPIVMLFNPRTGMETPIRIKEFDKNEHQNGMGGNFEVVPYDPNYNLETGSKKENNNIRFKIFFPNSDGKITSSEMDGLLKEIADSISVAGISDSWVASSKKYAEMQEVYKQALNQ